MVDAYEGVRKIPSQAPRVIRNMILSFSYVETRELRAYQRPVFALAKNTHGYQHDDLPRVCGLREFAVKPSFHSGHPGVVHRLWFPITIVMSGIALSLTGDPGKNIDERTKPHIAEIWNLVHEQGQYGVSGHAEASHSEERVHRRHTRAKKYTTPCENGGPGSAGQAVRMFRRHRPMNCVFILILSA